MFVLKLQSAEVILIPTAHYGAWDILGILHRDISSGNILIYPIIDTVGNTRHIIWQGVLADWEMAKNMREEERKRQELEAQQQREFEARQRQQQEQERLALEQLQQQQLQQYTNAAAARVNELEREILGMRGQYERDQLLLEQYDRVS